MADTETEGLWTGSSGADMRELSRLVAAEQGLAEGVSSLLPTLLPVDEVSRVLELEGKVSVRRRKLPAETLVWVLVGLALFRHLSIKIALEHFGVELPSRAAVWKGSQRLGVAAVRRIFLAFTHKWTEEAAALDRFQGMNLLAIDGTTLRVADTPEIERYFGRPPSTSPKTKAAWPQFRLLCAFQPSSRLVVHASYDRYGTSEHTLLRRMLRSLPRNSLLLLDAGFPGFALLHQIRAAGHHFIVRASGNVAKGGTPINARARRTPLDQWIDMAIHTRARKNDPWLPTTYRVRRVRWEAKGHKAKRLLTSLPKDLADKKAIIELYTRRWTAETGFDDLKNHLAQSSPLHLRSRTIRGLRQELWATLLAYNLIRIAMHRSAQTADEPGLTAADLSFTDCYVTIRSYLNLIASGGIANAARLHDLLLTELHRHKLTHRPNRSHPREQKQPPVRYARKRLPKP